MTPQLLASIAAIVISLAASYLPWFSTWYSALNTVWKRLAMATLLCIIALSAYLLSCAGYGTSLNLSLTCDVSGALGLFRTFLAALLANQATYQLTKPSTTEQIYAAAKIIQARKPTGAKK